MGAKYRCELDQVATSPSSLACSSKTVSKTKAIFSSLTEVVMFSQSHIQQQPSPVRLMSVELSSLEAVGTKQWKEVEGSRGTLGSVGRPVS